MSKKYTEKQISFFHYLINELEWRAYKVPDEDLKNVLTRLIELIAKDLIELEIPQGERK